MNRGALSVIEDAGRVGYGYGLGDGYGYGYGSGYGSGYGDGSRA